MNIRQIVKQPVITEKSVAQAAGGNKYTFIVDRSATKNQIKEAIESIYGVKVLKINTIHGHRVRKATGRKRLKTIVAPQKKAIVQLQPGQTIDVFDFGGTN